MSVYNYFVPASQQVTAITRANPGVVTTADAHGYADGLYVRFFFPINFGMMELNGNVYKVTVLTSDTFSIDQNTTTFTAFDSSPTTQVPQVIPIAEISSTLENAEKNNGNIIPEWNWVNTPQEGS